MMKMMRISFSSLISLISSSFSSLISFPDVSFHQHHHAHLQHRLNHLKLSIQMIHDLFFSSFQLYFQHFSLELVVLSFQSRPLVSPQLDRLGRVSSKFQFLLCVDLMKQFLQ